jgi:hypothetical protein
VEDVYVELRRPYFTDEQLIAYEASDQQQYQPPTAQETDSGGSLFC